MKHEPFNESTEMYLKTVCELAPLEGAVPISSLARRLGVSTVSATEMIHRLEDQGLLEHAPYKGIYLTEDGQKRATQVKRSHQLWEVFLLEKLSLPWEEVHDLACRLEHATDQVITNALSVFLGHPERCPHGNPIPATDGRTVQAETVTLKELKPGERAIVNNIHPESTMLLEHLAQHNLKPQQAIEVTEIAPFNGPIMVRAGQEVHAIGQEVAAHVFVIRQ